MKNISILGSTGSIGLQTLEVVRQFPEEFRIVGLTSNKNSALLLKQIKEFRPKAAAILDNSKVDELLNFSSTQVYSGRAGMSRIATLPEADTIVNSLVGSAGIEPTYDAIRAGKDIALANKETLVAAGSVIMEEAKSRGINLVPIDSEHSAIMQCLKGEDVREVERITLTCSGGPFRNLTTRELQDVKVEDALKHPTWKMGSKITIDSATLMNKGLEVIEAHWLYGIDYEKIRVVIHPQSIVHSLVEFSDKSVMAQLGLPDMRIPIQYALSHPKRLSNTMPSLDLAKIGKLEFNPPDIGNFPCLGYAYEAGRTGGTLPAVMNAANEIAVSAFLENKIRFHDIQRIIRKMMDGHSVIANPDLSQILKIDIETKEKTGKMLSSK